MNGDVAPEQSLNNEIRHHSAVIGMHAGPVGVEDPRDLDTQSVLAPIVEKQRLGTALAFIVAGARTNWVDVPPIILGLRVNARITIHFRRGRLEDAGPHAFREPQHVDRTMDTGLRRLHRIVLIVNRRSRASEVINLVHLDIKWKRHVVTDKLESVMVEQMVDVAPRAGEEIVDAYDIRAVRNQPFTEMRTEKAGPPGNHDAGFKMHVRIPFSFQMTIPFSEPRHGGIRLGGAAARPRASPKLSSMRRNRFQGLSSSMPIASALARSLASSSMRDSAASATMRCMA